jgi:hypothetical protein
MKVQSSNILKSVLRIDKLQTFISKFEQYKSSDEFGSYVFGKDGKYTPPFELLNHVHIIPVFMDDPQYKQKLKEPEIKKTMDKWNKDWDNKSRKTSNRVLIYAKSGNEYLLIFILENAHETINSTEEKHKQFFLWCNTIAEKFIDFGEIIA